MDLATVLLTADAGLVLLAAYFTVVSFHEKEPRAPWVGAIATVLLAGVGPLIVAVPAVRTVIGVIFGAALAFGSVLLIPTRGNPRALQGTAGHVVGEAARFDERDEVFARNRSLPPGSEATAVTMPNTRNAKPGTARAAARVERSGGWGPSTTATGRMWP